MSKKLEQLGMNPSTASQQLRKSLLFNFAKKCDELTCFQCGEEIETIQEFSIEHKTPWLDSENPKELFFDIENIAFSHYMCNISARRKAKSYHSLKEKDPLAYAGMRIGKSGYKGVTLVNKNKYKYQSYIRHDGKNVHIKYGNDPKELAELYDAKAIELKGEEEAITNKKLGLL